MQTSEEKKSWQALARKAWQTLEPYHAMIYFSPEARSAFSAAGLKEYWMGYFASRSAPLGEVPTSVVTATFYNFHARMVARALPEAWRYSTPQDIIAIRQQAADHILRRLLNGQVATDEITEAADLARQAVEGCDVVGRPLFAAYTALPWPKDPHLVLWHAATLLREYRGDGHSIALMAAELNGCEALVTFSATGKVAAETMQQHRGWTNDEWQAAQQRLQARGLLDDIGNLTEQGKAVRQTVEDQTDQLALPPWRHLNEERVQRLLELALPLVTTIINQGGIPFPNPVGLSRP